MRPAKRYRMVKAIGHPIASISGLMLLHRKVLYDAIGPGPHPCYWCGVAVDWAVGASAIRNLVADHIDHDKSNNAPENLVAACNACNGHRLGHDDWTPWNQGDPIGEIARETAYCRRGHAMTEDNVYRRPSNPARRQCRQCIKLRTRMWADRHRAKVPAP